MSLKQHMPRVQIDMTAICHVKTSLWCTVSWDGRVTSYAFFCGVIHYTERKSFNKRVVWNSNINFISF